MDNCGYACSRREPAIPGFLRDLATCLLRPATSRDAPVGGHACGRPMFAKPSGGRRLGPAGSVTAGSGRRPPCWRDPPLGGMGSPLSRAGHGEGEGRPDAGSGEQGRGGRSPRRAAPADAPRPARATGSSGRPRPPGVLTDGGSGPVVKIARASARCSARGGWSSGQQGLKNRAATSGKPRRRRSRRRGSRRRRPGCGHRSRCGRGRSRSAGRGCPGRGAVPGLVADRGPVGPALPGAGPPRPGRDG